MSKDDPVNHLNTSFYTTPKVARQIMSYQDWHETAEVTQCRILACGETYELTARHIGGGMYEISANLTYWKRGKPRRAKTTV